MVFERSGDGPLKWVPAAPTSPTPSYQTANTGASTNSPTPSSYAPTSTTTSPSSPYWRNDTTPPFSPGSSSIDTFSSYSSNEAANCAYDGDSDEYWHKYRSISAVSSSNKSQALRMVDKAVLEESNMVRAAASGRGKSNCSAELRALNLFDAQYSGDVHKQRLANDGTSEVYSYKSDSDIIRQKAANRRALSLVEQHVQNQNQEEDAALAMGLALRCEVILDGDEEEDVGDEDVSGMKSDIDKYRQRGANMRALGLLDMTAAGEKYKPATERPAPRIVSGGGLTARQAANLAYEKHKREKSEVKAKMKDLEAYSRRPPKIVVPVRKEKLAETTRKKLATQGDLKDPETVSGMKCQLHWDREKEAQAKALRLLNEGYML